ncbi:hypothetical protein PTMSG1_09881 [Pyrenophora teres f. maculata]|nr:hypothetical protein PTMSG1_09881 [Pyrenophora teres f. maculata]
MLGIRYSGLVVALSSLAVVAADGPTSIFIDSIPEYRLLAKCAEKEVSTIVRDMVYGCGDGGNGAYQSFACFCYESSAKFSSMIGAHVQTVCPKDPSQNTTALQVFSSYCEAGQSMLAQPAGSATFTATSSSAPSKPSAFASPASMPVSVSSTPTATSTVPSSSSSPSPAPAPKKKSHTVAIAVSVIVPIFVIAFGILAFFFLRSRKPNMTNGPVELCEEAVEQPEMAHEVDAYYKAEMPSGIMAHELGGNELNAERLREGH